MRLAFSGGDWIVQPAAIAWPPPPNTEQISLQSTSGEERREILLSPPLCSRTVMLRTEPSALPDRPEISSRSSSVAPASRSICCVIVAREIFPSR